MGFWRFFTFTLTLLAVNTAVATEDDLYDFLWLDPDKKVYVLQNKTHEKKGRFMFDLGYIRGLSSKFQNTNGFQVKAGYYFTEEWEFELFWNQYTNSNNGTYDNLGTVNATVPFVRRPKQTLGGVVNWSPFYGKLNTFNKIIYFDWSLGAGIANVETDSNAATAADSTIDRYDSESNMGVVLKTDLKFHINKNVHLNFEYQNVFFQEQGPNPRLGKQTDQISDLVISVGFSF